MQMMVLQRQNENRYTSSTGCQMPSSSSCPWRQLRKGPAAGQALVSWLMRSYSFKDLGKQFIELLTTRSSGLQMVLVRKI